MGWDVFYWKSTLTEILITTSSSAPARIRRKLLSFYETFSKSGLSNMQRKHFENHPLDLFGDKAKVEKVLSDFESFFSS